jgi:2-phosphosulfolactate phosphatase
MPPRKTIRVDVHLSHSQIEEMGLKDKNVVVIDVLRASTTIVTALNNGAKDIIPVNSVESLVKVSSTQFGDVTLRAGERNGKMIEGFNLGNSPIEYKESLVKGKSIILLTTNGSVAVAKGRYAKNVVVCGFVNLSSVVDFLAVLGEDFTLICAGKENHFCMEDTVCAGKLINSLRVRLGHDVVVNDAGCAAQILDESQGKNIPRMLKNSEHGKYLASIGFVDDLKACGSLDEIPLVPVFTGNIIRAANTVVRRTN